MYILYILYVIAVMRFPLPEGVFQVDNLNMGDTSHRMYQQPPKKLQLSIYETRFFSDQKLGIYIYIYFFLNIPYI